MLELRADDGVPVLYADGQRVGSFIDDLFQALPSIAGEASLEDVRWLGSVAVVLAVGLPSWPSRYAISKYTDYLMPPLSRELSLSFAQGMDAAFDQVRSIDSPGTSIRELGVLLAAWVEENTPSSRS